jgi:hypothetical protein
MSKRAKELAEAIEGIASYWGDNKKDSLQNVAFVIDAELRKERERCADRAQKAIACDLSLGLIKREAVNAFCAAILADMDDEEVK